MDIPALALTAAALLAALPTFAQPLAFRDAGGVRYACGGVGSEERAELAALRKPGQLEILFVTARRGAYLSGIDVELAREGAPPARFRAEGPTCLVEAPAGAWRVSARHGDSERRQAVTLGAKGARATLTFPDDNWDGIRASEEEKRQARE